MEEFDFLLQDRIAKIQAINEQYNLLENSYISFSGGKDSVILSHLIDLALPNNNIPRVYANTGIEYALMVKYVKDLSKKDNRIIIVNQFRNIRKTLVEYGYPFKSKEFSLLNLTFHNMKSKGLEVCEKYKRRIEGDTTVYRPISKKLQYLFTDKLPFKISDKCCLKLKKDLMHKWQKENKKTIAITGIRKDEGGRRSNLMSCLTNQGTKFHPLLVVTDAFENEFLKRFNIELCALYYPPYNFDRTGCKGCPFNIHLQRDLKTLKELLPNEYKQCLFLWKPVYEEYKRIGFRLEGDL